MDLMKSLKYWRGWRVWAPKYQKFSKYVKERGLCAVTEVWIRSKVCDILWVETKVPPKILSVGSGGPKF